MNEPDVKKSMNDLWIQEGKTKADIYIAKFEKMGEIEFNYSDGTSRFTKVSSLDYVESSKFKENPYSAESLPQIDEPTKESLETYVKSSIDLEKVVHDIVMNIVKDSILTNTEKANTDMQEEIEAPVDRLGFGVNVSQTIKPMEESFVLSMKEIVESENYKKINLPNKLNEDIFSGDNNFLIQENESMQKWEFEDTTYFTPKIRLSKTKGYIKS